MVETCCICLQDLCDDIGSFVSCGHCVHRTCFKEYLATYQGQQELELSQQNYTRYRPPLPKCPLCLAIPTHFQPLYISFPKKISAITGPEYTTSDDSSRAPVEPYHHTPPAHSEALYNIYQVPSIEQLQRVAKMQHNTMLIQTQINIIQNSFVDEICNIQMRGQESRAYLGNRKETLTHHR